MSRAHGGPPGPRACLTAAVLLLLCATLVPCAAAAAGSSAQVSCETALGKLRKNILALTYRVSSDGKLMSVVKALGKIDSDAEYASRIGNFSECLKLSNLGIKQSEVHLDR